MKPVQVLLSQLIDIIFASSIKLVLLEEVPILSQFHFTKVLTPQKTNQSLALSRLLQERIIILFKLMVDLLCP